MCVHMNHFRQNRMEILFIRVSGRHVGEHITLWRLADYSLWTLAATLLVTNYRQGNLLTDIIISSLIITDLESTLITL